MNKSHKGADVRNNEKHRPDINVRNESVVRPGCKFEDQIGFEIFNLGNRSRKYQTHSRPVIRMKIFTSSSAMKVIRRASFKGSGRRTAPSVEALEVPPKCEVTTACSSLQKERTMHSLPSRPVTSLSSRSS